MQQWEYKTENFSVNTKSATWKLPEWGLEGWELCGILEIHADFVKGIFKRPLPESATDLFSPTKTINTQ